MIFRSRSQQGFSLIWISTAVAVAGVIIAASLPVGDKESDGEKQRVTLDHMHAIEEATKGFMIANQRRPCPADATLPQGSPDFGTEVLSSGTCITNNFSDLSTASGTIVAGSATLTLGSGNSNLHTGQYVSGTGIYPQTRVLAINGTAVTLDHPAGLSGSYTFSFFSALAGAVPTRTLGLSDDIALDGYGRRITYVVDANAISAQTCHDQQSTGEAGSIAVRHTPGGVDQMLELADENVMWALISYGRDGHGAFPAKGSSIGNRINNNNYDGDQQTNAFVNASFANVFGHQSYPSPYNYTSMPDPINVVIKDTYIGGMSSVGSPQEPFSGFAWYLPQTKNTCCIGEACQYTSSVGLGNIYPPSGMASNIAVGDFNGDGIQDMAITITDNSASTQKTYVIFGKKKGWVMPNSLNGLSQYFDATTQLNGTNGFVITTPVVSGSYYTVAGDLNGDGYDDVIFPCYTGYCVLFGGPGPKTGANTWATNWPATIDTSAFNGTNGTVITLPFTGTATYPMIAAVGDVNGDGTKDLVYQVLTDGGYGPGSAGVNSDTFVVYGRSSWPATITSLDGTTNFEIQGTGSRYKPVLGVGDLNNDGIADIFIAGDSSDNYPGWLIWGRSSASWASALNSSHIYPVGYPNTGANVVVGTSYSLMFGYVPGPTVATFADMNGDGLPDMIFPFFPLNAYPGKSGFPVIIYDKSSGWSSSLTIDTMNSSTGAYLNSSNFSVAGYTGTGGTGAGVTQIMAADINGDGKNDLIINNFTYTGSGNYYTLAPYVYFQPSTGFAAGYNPGLLNGTNGFTIGLPLWSGGQPYNSYALAVGDFNGDGKNDIAILSQPSYMLQILFGRQTIPWESAVSFANVPFTAQSR